MPIINRIAEYQTDMTGWRRYLHENPELGLECHETAAFVVERLKEFGVDEIHTGIATSGVVAIINGTGAGPTIGLRADMDALPMSEETGAKWASKRDGLMHACGHDGHTTMLLGAAKYMCETRRFAGRIALIFQPAEENDGGGRIMVEEGMMERFDIKEVYGIHNVPNHPMGHFFTTPGPLMAGADTFHINITGRGTWRLSHETRDPVMAAVQIAQAFQTIVTRNLHPIDKLVISVTQIHTGTVDNVIPETAYMNGTVRHLIRRASHGKAAHGEICAGLSAAMGVEVDFEYREGYPPTINHADQATFATDVARDVAGMPPLTGTQAWKWGPKISVTC